MERGGLGPREMYAVVHDMGVYDVKYTDIECEQWLKDVLEKPTPEGNL